MLHAMGSNRYSLDSQINFSSPDSLKHSDIRTGSARSNSLTNSNRYPLSETSNSLSSASRKLSRTQIAKSSLQNTFSRRLPKDSTSTTSGASSINSLFIMNRVKSFTWKLRRQLIQTSIESNAIPPEVLYPTKLGVSLDNFILFSGNRSCSCDASSLSAKPSSGSIKLKSKTRNSSLYRQDSKNRFRHSMDSSMQKKEIVCSHHDFKSIIYFEKEKRNINKSSLKRENYRNSKKRTSVNTMLNTVKSPMREEWFSMKHRNGNSCFTNFPDSLGKFNMSHKGSHTVLPRRSLSDGSLDDLRKVVFEIGEAALDYRSGEKYSLQDSGRLYEIEETDKEALDRSQSQESIYNFTLPNIQILGDAIQQHLKLLMGIQFGEMEKSPIPSVFELTTNEALLNRIFNSFRHTKLNCCC